MIQVLGAEVATPTYYPILAVPFSLLHSVITSHHIEQTRTIFTLATPIVSWVHRLASKKCRRFSAQFHAVCVSVSPRARLTSHTRNLSYSPLIFTFVCLLPLAW
eukprot:scaffold135432_cov39-Tisochrysis_lutea.AAC.1